MTGTRGPHQWMESFECLLKVKLKTEECEALDKACVAATAKHGRLINRSDLVRDWIGGGCLIPVKLKPLPLNFMGSVDEAVEAMLGRPPCFSAAEAGPVLKELKASISKAIHPTREKA